MVILRLSYFHFDSFVWAGCFQKSPAFIQAFWAHGCVQPSKLHSAKGRTKSFGQILLRRRSWIAFTKQIPFVRCVLSVFWKQFHLSCVGACGNWASKSVRMAGFHMWGPSLSLLDCSPHESGPLMCALCLMLPTSSNDMQVWMGHQRSNITGKSSEGPCTSSDHFQQG